MSALWWLPSCAAPGRSDRVARLVGREDARRGGLSSGGDCRDRACQHPQLCQIDRLVTVILAAEKDAQHLPLANRRSVRV